MSQLRAALLSGRLSPRAPVANQCDHKTLKGILQTSTDASSRIIAQWLSHSCHPRASRGGAGVHAALQELKRQFATILQVPDPSCQFVVEVDAPNTGVGAVLLQKAQLYPCTFFYDVGNQELLAIKLALEEWRHWLEGADHMDQPLQLRIYPNGQEARWSLFFTHLNFAQGHAMERQTPCFGSSRGRTRVLRGPRRTFSLFHVPCQRSPGESRRGSGGRPPVSLDQALSPANGSLCLTHSGRTFWSRPLCLGWPATLERVGQEFC